MINIKSNLKILTVNCVYTVLCVWVKHSLRLQKEKFDKSQQVSKTGLMGILSEKHISAMSDPHITPSWLDWTPVCISQDIFRSICWTL